MIFFMVWFKNLTYKAGILIAGGIDNQKESTCNVRDTGDAGSTPGSVS